GVLQSGLGGGRTSGFINGAFGTGGVNLAGGTLSLQMGGGQGLIGGRLAGAFDVTTANPGNVFAQGTVEGQDNVANNGTTTGDLGLNWKDNQTWVYGGQFFFG